MKIQLKVLTPVHIGSGQEISPIEYVCYDSKNKKICTKLNGDKFIRINMDELFKDEEFKPLMEEFIKSAKSQRNIGGLLPQDLLLHHTLYKIDISQTAKGSNLIAVKEFIKSVGRVYIPGSSLKGSILSGVIENILREKRIQKFENYRKHLGDVLSEITKQLDRADMREFSHWLDIRDSNLKTPQEAIEISQAEVVGARSRRRTTIPILYETLKENSEFETEIISHCHKSEGEILKRADEFYRKVYKKEREFYQILPQVQKDSFLLRIGQGSTAYSTSFLILAEELRIKNYTIQRPRFHRVSGEPRTRRLISGKKSMGWVEVKLCPEH